MSVKTADTATPVRRKSKRAAGAAPPELEAHNEPEAQIQATVAAATPVPEPQVGAAIPSVLLEHSLQIKDVEEAHRRLMVALAQGPAMILDLSRLATVDTAGVQLLLSLRSEASRRGVRVEFRGDSAAFTQALAILGLRDAFPATSP